MKHLKNLSEWKEKKNILKLDQLNNWKLSLVVEVQKTFATIKTLENDTIKLDLQNIKWARKYISPDSLGPEITNINQVLNI